MAYLYLTIAIIGELIGTTLLKYSNGFTKLLPTVGCLVSYVACFYYLSKSLEHINLSFAYATWSAVGIIATTLISVFILKEGISPLGILGIILMVAGVILLNVFGSVTTH